MSVSVLSLALSGLLLLCILPRSLLSVQALPGSVDHHVILPHFWVGSNFFAAIYGRTTTLPWRAMAIGVRAYLCYHAFSIPGQRASAHLPRGALRHASINKLDTRAMRGFLHAGVNTPYGTAIIHCSTTAFLLFLPSCYLPPRRYVGEQHGTSPSRLYARRHLFCTWCFLCLVPCDIRKQRADTFMRGHSCEHTTAVYSIEHLPLPFTVTCHLLPSISLY